MATSETSRFRLPQWGAGTDPYPGRSGWNNILRLLEDQAAVVYPSGPIANRPRSGTFGRFFLATDQGTAENPVSRLYYDGGSGWVELNTNGGGGPGTPISIGGSASEGVSSRSARADHVHTLPMASSYRAGALSAGHYDLLAGAATTVNANMLVKRTSSGNVVVPTTPGGSNDAASKAYVDYRTGTSSSGGTTSNPDIEDATGAIVPGALVRRGSDGGFLVPPPTHLSHPTTKTYVDNHRWDGEDLNKNGNDVWWEIISGSTSAYATAQSGAVYTVSVNSSGRFMRFTSKRADKDRIQVLAVDPRRLLSPVPTSYVRRDPDTGEAPDDARTEWGFIVEDEYERVPELVITETAEDGTPTPESWDNNSLIAAHQALHRWTADRDDTQDQRIQQLENDNAELKQQVKDLAAAVARLTA